MEVILCFFLILTAFAIGVGIRLLCRNREKQESPERPPKNPTDTNEYYRKDPLMTPTELRFYKAISVCLPSTYHLLPQIPLAAIVEKGEESRYHNELFRIIDFGIFDSEWNTVCVIEINDDSHKEYKRIQRDIKVKNILESAGIPIITLWTEYGVKSEYIEKRINEYIH